MPLRGCAAVTLAVTLGRPHGFPCVFEFSAPDAEK